MRIVCWQTILMKYHTFFWKLRKKSQNLSSAPVVIGALRAKVKNGMVTFCLLHLHIRSSSLVHLSYGSPLQVQLNCWLIMQWHACMLQNAQTQAFPYLLELGILVTQILLKNIFLLSTVLPAKSDSDIRFWLQSYQGLIINRSLRY